LRIQLLCYGGLWLIRLRHSTRLDSVVTTIDAIEGLRHLEGHPVAIRQCAVADRRLITKVDLVDGAQIAELRERLFALNRGASVVEVSRGAIDSSVVFGAALYDEQAGRSDLDGWLKLEGHRAGEPRQSRGIDIRFSSEETHNSEIGSWLLEEWRRVDWPRLSARLGKVIACDGDKLLRLKGVIWTLGDSRPLVVHGVQRMFHAPARLDRWTREPATSIVIIGDRGSAAAVESIADALADSAFNSVGADVNGSDRAL
jgi:G3E family GTPase